VCYSSNASFRTNSDIATCIVSLLCSLWQWGGAIYNGREGTVDIKGSKFEGNTANNAGNNIYREGGTITCKDVENTFNSPNGNAEDDLDGNCPAGLCASTVYSLELGRSGKKKSRGVWKIMNAVYDQSRPF